MPTEAFNRIQSTLASTQDAASTYIRDNNASRSALSRMCQRTSGAMPQAVSYNGLVNMWPNGDLAKGEFVEVRALVSQ